MAISEKDRNLADELNKKSIGFLTLDFVGHGYSDGERTVIESYEYLLNDIQLVLELILKEYLIPFYILGHSMGGGIAIILSDYIWNNKINIARSLYRSTILIAPLIHTSIPKFLHKIIFKLADHFPLKSFPFIDLFNNTINKKIWNNDAFIDYIENDKLTTNNLSYFISIKTLIKITYHIEQIVENICFPFIIIHDEFDEIVPFSGSEYFYNKSKTKDKKIFKIIDGLHDPIVNKIDDILKIIFLS